MRILEDYRPNFPVRDDMLWFIEQSRTPRLLTMLEFAEQKIIIPDGPFANRRFRADRQPYARLFFEAVDSGKWNRFVSTGPTQSGKSLTCFVIPALYHLFEIRETVICGVPDMDIAGDKWREDFLPVIERSEFRHLLPTKGAGSRGGRVESIKFKNGATLKFMSGGGSDKNRAAFTSRVLVVTETDGLDEAGGQSREADKLTQMEARTRAFGDQKRIYMECTVSTETGRTWQEYIKGTQSRIASWCKHCKHHVTPERPDLLGWQDCEDKLDAKKNAFYACPNCRKPFTEQDRVDANRKSILLHEGQYITDAGKLDGQPKQTDTCGFRWSAFNNLLISAGQVGVDEFEAQHSIDEENADRKMKQFVWALPCESLIESVSRVDTHELTKRTRPIPRGVAPKETTVITVGVDVGKYLLHWAAVAWCPGATGHVVEYGNEEVPTQSLGFEKALTQALYSLREKFTAGWPIGLASGELMPAEQVWIDAGYGTDEIYKFCRQCKIDGLGNTVRPVMGQGAMQRPTRFKLGPRQTGSVVKFIGEGYHFSLIQAKKVQLVEIDSDHWKTWLHERLSCPLDQHGSLSLFKAPSQDHLAISKHLTAEEKTEQFVAGRGVVATWKQLRKHNHWLDAMYYACAAGHYAGIRLTDESKGAQKRPRKTLQEMARAAK